MQTLAELLDSVPMSDRAQAKRLRLSPQALSDFRRGKSCPRRETASRMARFYQEQGLTVTWQEIYAMGRAATARTSPAPATRKRRAKRATT